MNTFDVKTQTTHRKFQEAIGHRKDELLNLEIHTKFVYDTRYLRNKPNGIFMNKCPDCGAKLNRGKFTQDVSYVHYNYYLCPICGYEYARLFGWKDREIK